MKFYIIAGEASGDMHGANLVKAVKEAAPDALFQGWGGDRMEEEGVELGTHIRELAFMGFSEVIMNLKTILSNIKRCKSEIAAYSPDALILIDYPGFNLRIARWAKKRGFKVLYYISPQVWAWKSKRVHAIKRDVDELYTILPFESIWYQQYDMEVKYVGHPLLDELQRRNVAGSRPEKGTIALLPGSRKQEIQRILPIMLEVSQRFPEHTFEIACAPSLETSYYDSFGHPEVKRHSGDTYRLLSRAEAALVTSGTATLETALIDVPQVVCYKGSAVSYHIAKRLVNLNYISLVNLIMDAPVVKELIQAQMNTEEVSNELNHILSDSPSKKMKENYRKLREILGGPGASARCASAMLKKTSMPQELS